MEFERTARRIRIVIGLVSLGVFSEGALRAQLSRWQFAQGGNGHYYQVVSAPSGINWANASLAATNRGGYLATITSPEENAFIFNLATVDATVWYSGYGPWLGGIQPAGSAEPAGGWRWITGEPFIFKNWAPVQPNNNQNEDRIQFGGQADRSSAWNDINQNNTNYTRGFVVEYDVHPNSVTMAIARKDADKVVLSWPSRLNVSYSVEWTEDLAGPWIFLTTVVGTGSTLTVEDSLAGSGRFYRCAGPE